MTKVAFLGLGNMGGPMAANLVKAGFHVTAYDLMPTAIEQAVQNGCSISDNPLDAVTGAEFIISMLPSGTIVESLYLEKDQLLEHIADDALVLDCSTIEPRSARRVAAAAEAKGIAFMDAPVSGGVAGAEAGTLAFMCGGSVESFERSQRVLYVMGKNIFHAGKAGAGQVAKICNNMLLAVQMVGTAESLQLGINNGLDPKVLTEIMSKSTSGCWSLNVQNPVAGVSENAPAGNDYQGGFMTRLMQKDLGIALETVKESASNAPMGALASSLFTIHAQANSENALLDFSSVIKLFQNK